MNYKSLIRSRTDEYLKIDTKPSGACAPVRLANECYWAGNNLEVGLMVADDNDSLYYLDSITFKEDDTANIYGYAYDYKTYCEELDGQTDNDPENELMKIVRFDN